MTGHPEPICGHFRMADYPPRRLFASPNADISQLACLPSAIMKGLTLLV